MGGCKQRPFGGWVQYRAKRPQVALRLGQMPSQAAVNVVQLVRSLRNAVQRSHSWALLK